VHFSGWGVQKYDFTDKNAIHLSKKLKFMLWVAFPLRGIMLKQGFAFAGNRSEVRGKSVSG
jgi:hypothetical protein